MRPGNRITGINESRRLEVQTQSETSRFRHRVTAMVDVHRRRATVRNQDYNDLTAGLLAEKSGT